MSLNWDDLKIALAIARAGSLSRGALVLGIDQSTAGRRLSALEAQIGTILFTRSKSGFSPTEAGDAVIRHAAEIERRLDRMTEGLDDADAPPAGMVRLIGNAWMLKHLAETELAGFMQRNPRLTIRLISRSPQVPARGDATVSLWFEAAPRTGEFSIKLCEVPYAVYRARGAEGEAWVSFFDEDAPRRAPVRAWEKMRQGPERPVLGATDATMLISAIRSGIGRGLLPMCLAADDPALERVGEGSPELVRTLNLHTHPDTVQTKRVQATIRWLRECGATVFSAGYEPPAVRQKR